jgi:endonuclease-8
MPEGDTLARVAAVLRRVLSGRRIVAARGGPGGAQLERVVGARVESVESRGKHLLIAFDNGLTLHTHLGLHGSWHHYRRGERWRRPAVRAVAVLETPDQVAVAFDAPTVELFDSRAAAIHPVLRGLGTDLADPAFEPAASLSALRSPERAGQPIGEALLDQGVAAGLGNVYRSELPFIARVSPFTPVESLSDDQLRALLERGARLIRANSRGGARVTTTPGSPSRLYVYGRTGRPCLRCGTPITSAVTRAHETANPRRVYWCPRCQPASRST